MEEIKLLELIAEEREQELLDQPDLAKKLNTLQSYKLIEVKEENLVITQMGRTSLKKGVLPEGIPMGQANLEEEIVLGTETPHQNLFKKYTKVLIFALVILSLILFTGIILW